MINITEIRADTYLFLYKVVMGLKKINNTCDLFRDQYWRGVEWKTTICFYLYF